MTYSRITHAEEQQKACQQAEHIATICKDLHITLDPIDWQQHGMWAPVKVEGIEIAYLLDFGHPNADDILRRVRIKLLEHAALRTLRARPGLKASMWSPVEVVQPQPFVSLWVISFESGERVPISESIRDGQHIYEPYQFDRNDKEQLTKLFGPMSPGGAYHSGDTITIKEREHQYTGEIIYSIPAGKTYNGRTSASRGYHTVGGTAYTNEVAPKYIVDCNDGFPHIVHQSQVIQS